MRKSLFKYILTIVLAASVTACGTNAVSMEPGLITEANPEFSSDSFFNKTDANYPKVHPKFYNKKYPVAVMAHRGFRDVAPENTIASFRKALQIGADMVETDVHLTKDRQVIIMHDDTIDRTTNGKGPVENFTLEQLKKFDAGSKFSPVFKGEPIPTLEDLLQFAKDKISLNIEIKKTSVEKRSQDGIEKKVVDLIAKYGMEEYVIISSFSEVALTRVKQLNPHISTGLLMVSDGLFRSPVSKVASVKADAFHEMGKFVYKNEITKLHQFDIEQNTWTINDPHQMSELINKGVDSLITDRPDLALRVLEEKFPARNL